MFLSENSVNNKLAIFTVVLGIIAVFIGDPTEGNTVSIDTKEIAIITENSSDIINPKDLADWLVQGRADYILVDVSNLKEYEKYHIPGAVCLSMNSLQEAELPRNEKIILYSSDDTKTAQAWFLLKGMKYPDVYRIDGGLNSWKSNVMNPDIASTASLSEMELFEKRKVLASYFGGIPTMDGKAIKQSEGGMKISKPVLQVSSSLKKKRGKIKKEGC
ncbi:rhodanese-like domain-containing protein [bacterium]|nr:rhodanese-like domain-containing protein [bacterium]